MKQLKSKRKGRRKQKRNNGLSELERELDNIIIFDDNESFNRMDGKELISNLRNKEREPFQEIKDDFRENNFVKASIPQTRRADKENDYSKILDTINQTERNHKERSSFKKRGVSGSISRRKDKKDKPKLKRMKIEPREDTGMKVESDDVKMKIEQKEPDKIKENVKMKIEEKEPERIREEKQNTSFDSIKETKSPIKKEGKDERIKIEKKEEDDKADMQQPDADLDSINDYNDYVPAIELDEPSKTPEQQKNKVPTSSSEKMTMEEVAKYFRDSLKKQEPYRRSKKRQKSADLEIVTEQLRVENKTIGSRYVRRQRVGRLCPFWNETYEYNSSTNQMAVTRVQLKNETNTRARKAKGKKPLNKNKEEEDISSIKKTVIVKKKREKKIFMVDGIKTEELLEKKNVKQWKMYFKKNDFKELSSLKSDIRFRVSCTPKLRSRDFFEIVYGPTKDELEKKILNGQDDFGLKKDLLYIIRNISGKSSNLLLTFTRNDD